MLRVVVGGYTVVRTPDGLLTIAGARADRHDQGHGNNNNVDPSTPGALAIVCACGSSADFGTEKSQLFGPSGHLIAHRSDINNTGSGGVGYTLPMQFGVVASSDFVYNGTWLPPKAWMVVQFEPEPIPFLLHKGTVCVARLEKVMFLTRS
jgi:hypothetical protein